MYNIYMSHYILNDNLLILHTEKQYENLSKSIEDEKKEEEKTNMPT